MEVYYPPVAFYFKLSFTGVSSAQDASFKEVSGISAEMNLEEISEGGENRYKHRLPTYVKYGDLELKRGLLVANSDLATWCFDTLGSGLNDAIQPKAITVTLLDADANPLMTWNFTNAYPIRWDISNLDSEDNKLVIESIKFAYSYFTKA